MSELDRRTLFRATAAGAGALAATAALPAEAAPPEVGRVLARELEIPWGVAFLPSGNALVSERHGMVHRVHRKGGRTRIGRVNNVSARGEGGLLGLAVSPTFRTDRWLYAYITTDDDNRVVRMRYVDGRLRDQRPVLTGIPKGNIHNGGRLAFHPNGLLFVSTGDTDSGNLAQNKSSLAGKILRITRDGDVPEGNPFGNPVFSFGHRNVQGLAFDWRGRLWATELGQSTRDELNRIVKGGNYGWPEVEGGDGAGGQYRDPFVTWQPTYRCSPSGLAIRKGYAWVGALAGEALFRVDISREGKRTKRRFFHEKFGRIRTVQEAPDGSLWITTSNAGRPTAAPRDDKVIRIRV
jgi:glucose/arabinose dehydrogenase